MRVQGDQADALIGADGTAGVETEPAQPENEAADRDQCQVVSGDIAWLAVLIESPQPRTEYDDTGERDPAARRVNHRGAGEIDEAHLGQPARAFVETAPCPATEHRIDDRTDDHRTDDVGREARPLRHRAAGDGHGCGSEHHLEQHECVLAGARLIEHEVIRTEPTTDVGAEHQAVTDDPERQRTQTQVEVVLHDDVDGVLAARHAALEQRETGLHEQHQCSRDDDPDSIACRLREHLGLLSISH